MTSPKEKRGEDRKLCPRGVNGLQTLFTMDVRSTVWAKIVSGFNRGFSFIKLPDVVRFLSNRSYTLIGLGPHLFWFSYRKTVIGKAVYGAPRLFSITKRMPVGLLIGSSFLFLLCISVIS